MEPGKDYHELAHSGPTAATVDPEYIAVRQFAHKELEESLTTFWCKHGIGVEEMNAGLRSHREEKEGLIEAAREFLCCLESLPSFSGQGRRVSRVTKQCRFDDVMI